MTLLTTLVRNDYTGTGTVGPFAFTFPIQNISDLVVIQHSATTGIDTILTSGVDFTPPTVPSTGLPNGGSITLTVALAVGDGLTIMRKTARTQPTSLRNAGTFFQETHETAFDRIVAMVQEHEEAFSRALLLPASTQPSAGIAATLPAPAANLQIGWDPTGKKLVNTAGTPGPAGPAGPPLVANAAARDALYPAPAQDQRVVRKDSGRQERFDQTAGRWLPEGITMAAGPTVSVMAKGAVGDGVTDDTATILAADTAAQAVGGMLYLDPTSSGYKVASNLTLASDLSPNSIGFLKPSLGAIVVVNGHVPPSLRRKLFDLSGGGTFSLVGNTHIREFFPQWFGADPTGVADASGILTSMMHCLPDWSTVVFTNGAIFALQYTWLVSYRTGMVFCSETLPADGFTNTTNPRLKWTGIAGGTMVGNYNNGSTTWMGLTLDMQNADVGLDTDELFITTTSGSSAILTQAANSASNTPGAGFLSSLPSGAQIAITFGGPGSSALVTTLVGTGSDPQHATIAVNASTTTGFSGARFAWPGFAPPTAPNTRISTNNVIERNLFLMTQARATAIGHAISRSARSNVEYMVHRHNTFASYAGQRWTFNAPDGAQPLALGGSITKGSNVFGGFTNNPFTNAMNGQPVYIAEGGAYNAGAKGWNASLNGYAQYIDANTLHLFQDAGLTTPLNAAHSWPPAPWSSVTAYTQGDFVVGSDGYFYYCTNNTTNNDPTSDFGNHWLKTPIGPYNAGTLYAAGDIVTSGGAIYMATNTNQFSGQAPPNTTYWQVMSPHFQLGTNYGTGVYIGPSQNAKRHTFYENHFYQLHIGIDCEGGSMHQIMSNFPNNDINVVFNSSQSEPSSEYGSNSENARQHIRMGNGPQPYAIEKSRFAMANVYPSSGYFAFVSGWSAPGAKFETIQFENYLPRTSQVFQGVGITVHASAKDVTFANATSLPEIGWDGHSMGGGSVWDFVRCTCSLAGAVVPYKGRFVDTQGFFNGTPFTHDKGTHFNSQAYVIQDSDFVGGSEWGWYAGSDGSGAGFRERVYSRYRNSQNNASMVFTLGIHGQVTLTDGASVSFEPTTGDYFVLSAGGSRSIQNYSNWLSGHVFTVRIFNNTAGAITTSWPSLYKLAGAWVDPAAGKSRTITFRMDSSAFCYEVSRSAADI